MANQDHLDILRRGISTWNMWRQQNQDVRPDLTNANLKQVDLNDADLSNVDLNHANLDFALLNSAKLNDADLTFATLNDVDLRFTGITGADLRFTSITSADLSDVNLRGISLVNADLSSSDFSNADLRFADLGDANFRSADLSSANLSNANLSYADLSYATLNDVNFSKAKIEGTIFGDHDLRTVKGLETMQHNGPSPLSINTIYQSEGDLPDIFVRGTGVPDSFIEYMHALASKPIQYYTCFISYSSKNQDFAERLYADLQSNGVRCWYAPHHMKIGEKIRPRIDESIRTHDKLLLILSEYSVKSEWVEKEVETALEKERRQKKMVLFPICLDETITRARRAWAADIRRMRHIGNFTSWKQHDQYQVAFQRLLHDLTANAEQQDNQNT